VDALGDFLTQLPMPLGPIVTGLLPFFAIVGFVVVAWAYRKGRRVVVAVGAVIGALSLIAMAAFLTATTT
jgi:hypothetical protein